MKASLCPCGCFRLEPCERGRAIIAERERKAKEGAGKRWDEHHERHPEWSALYKTERWRQLRDAQLAAHPWCKCGHKATEVDHIKPHRGDPALFYDPNNLDSACNPCHMAKTRRDR